MSPIKNFSSFELADKKRDWVGFSNILLEMVKKSLFSQNCQILTKRSISDPFGSRDFSKASFLDSPVNLVKVGEKISWFTRPQTTDQPANCCVNGYGPSTCVTFLYDILWFVELKILLFNFLAPFLYIIYFSVCFLY